MRERHPQSFQLSAAGQQFSLQLVLLRLDSLRLCLQTGQLHCTQKNHKQGCLKSTLGDQSLHHQQKKAVIIKGKLQWLLLLLLLYSPEGIQRLKVKLITRHTNCIGLTIKHELFTHLLKLLMTVVAGWRQKERIKNVSVSGSQCWKLAPYNGTIHRPFSSVRVSSCSLRWTISMRRRSSQCAPCRLRLQQSAHTLTLQAGDAYSKWL